MRIDLGYPSPSELKKNELETLKYIKDNNVFQSYYTNIASAASVSYFQFQNAPSFNFSSNLDICLDRRSGKMGCADIGLVIKIRDGRYEQVSYSLAIHSKVNTRYRLLRMYHFDYALPEVVSRQPHPVFHLQYAGGLFGRLENLPIQHAHLDAWLSEPRLFFTPMSLALLINIVFKEFPDKNAIEVIERSEWRTLIRKNEKRLLTPYFKCCHNFMNSRNNVGKLLTSDFYYGG